jgi:phospholipase A1
MKFLSRHHQRIVTAIAISLFWLGADAESQNAEGLPAQTSPMEKCLLANMEGAAPDTTIGELRTGCEQTVTKSTNAKTQDVPGKPMTPVEERMFDDQMNYDRSFAISTFQPNYFIATYNSDPNEAPFDPVTGDEDILDEGEAKFQVSFKAPLWRNMFGTNNDLLGAYTATSWWQIDNDDDDVSSAFRETNYQPEIFLRHYGGPEIFGGQVSAFDLGLNHESNGRSELLSRSWNRVMGRVYLDYDDIAIGIRAWYRIQEDEEDDDNPHMHRYYGYGDVLVAYAPNKNTFTAMLRPGTQENGLEFTWSYPISGILRIYAQYWNGYGESLLDYNVRTERIGIGFSLNDWIQRR